MRTRDVTIPLALWICAAVGAHFFLGTGGLVVAKVHDDRSELWKLARQAGSLASQGEQTFEVSLGESADEVVPPPPRTAPPPPLATAKPPEREAAKPAENKVPEKHALVVEKKPAEKAPMPLPDDPPKDRRIAVRQHAKPDQQDNPNAHFIADEANHVDAETAATQTSHDRDDEKPTPGGNHPGSDQQPGDSERTRIAENEQRAGARNRAPGERGTDFDVLREPKIPKATAANPTAVAPQSAPQARAASIQSADKAASPMAEHLEPQPGVGGLTAPSPEVEDAAEGSWTFNRAGPGGAAGAAPLAEAGSEGSNLPGGKMWSLPGLGQSSPTGAINVNLNQSQIAVIVGSDNLRRVREADGERRKSEHRGSWAASNFDRWRTAIENYASSVKPGNQTALNTAKVPFASYLNGIHNRIHPIFADSFLGSLDNLPPGHPMNDRHLVTRLEIVLTRNGHLRRMGVVRTSGITAFDIAALDAVDRAQPFGPAPSAIISPDGNVYLHWEFHRDEFACSTAGASPFILSMPPSIPEGPPQTPPAPPPGPGKEQSAPTSPNDAREGALPLALPSKGARWPS
jgi:TonB family protein